MKIAVSQAKAGEPKTAKKVINNAYKSAKEMENVSLLEQIWIFLDIAEAHVQAGNKREARKICQYAFKITKSSDDPNDQMNGFWEIAKTQAKAGSYGSALKTANFVDRPLLFSRLLLEIVKIQSQEGNFGNALKTANNIEFDHSEAMKYISIAKANSGEFKAALSTAQEISYYKDRAYALAQIAERQLQANQISEAIDTANKIEDNKEKIYSLGNIAAAQMQYGKSDEAKKTFDLALKTALSLQNKIEYDKSILFLAQIQQNAGDQRFAQNTIIPFQYSVYIELIFCYPYFIWRQIWHVKPNVRGSN